MVKMRRLGEFLEEGNPLFNFTQSSELVLYKNRGDAAPLFVRKTKIMSIFEPDRGAPRPDWGASDALLLHS